MEKPGRKRLKVVSACSECRRKKTKCNGQQPCGGCMKANVACKYVMPRQPSATWHDTSVTSPLLPSQSHAFQITNSIQSIEQRLGVIEEILRAVLPSVTLVDQQFFLAALDRPKKRRAEDDPEDDDSYQECTGDIGHQLQHPSTPRLPHGSKTDDKSLSIQLPPLPSHSPAIHNLLNRDSSPAPSPPTSSSSSTFGPSAFQRVVASSFS